MHHATTLIFSATDLSGFLACPQLTLLERANALGQATRPVYDDPSAEVLRRRGLEHEARWLEGRRRDGAGIVEIGGIDYAADRRAEWERAAAETLAAMRAGTEIIYQGVLFDGTWLGRPDFLERVDTPSTLGDWSYEVVDAKLAREAKGGALLQLMLYADLLERAQGQPPGHVHLELGGPNARRESFRTADYAAYFRQVRERFLAWADAAPAVLPCAPEPVEHCAICAWGERCKRERRDADHLSLVAGITAQQRQVLAGRGTMTLAALARLDRSISLRRDGVSDVALQRIREQARIQLEGRERDAHLHELLEPVSEPERGLCALPAPSPGDVFFDLEGDPFALGDGLEYLWGFTPRDGEYTAWRALDRDAEKAAFERFIDLVAARLERWPGLHVYHFGVYETTALKKLSGRHATREDALDRLLRGRVFVDLHRVVRQALRASVESYSIKKLEPLYAFERDVGLRDASGALAHFEAWLELGGGEGEGEGEGEALLAVIEGYNRDDCVSTLRLAEWLEGLRGGVEAERGECLPRPSPGDPEPPGTLGEELDETARLVGLLTEGVSAEAAEGTPDEPEQPEQHARWLLAQLLDYYRREDKSFWWEYFRCIDLDELEAVEDGATLGGLEYEGVVDTVKKSEIHRYRFPPQDHGIKVGKEVRDGPRERAAKEAQRAGDPDARASGPGTVVALDDHARTIDLKRGKGSTVPHPSVLVPFEYVNPDPMPESLRRLAVAVLAHGFTDANPHRAACDMLLRRAPRTHAPDTGASDAGGALRLAGEEPLASARRLVLELDRSILPIQGPPGAGKTFTGARMIVTALAAGRRVGVTANSHKVITNLLDEVCEVARVEGVAFQGIQKADDDAACAADCIECTKQAAEPARALREGAARLAAGTAWLWSREDMVGAVDVLFIDEAGQFSLANTLAVAPAAASLVLLGDPRQLDQPQKGTHPPGVAVSALEHLLDGAVTMPAEHGLFLEHTYRLHPDICTFTSEIFYESRLKSQPGLDTQRIRCDGAPDGHGLRFVAVAHDGNQSESPEEVEVVARLVARLVPGAASDGCAWVDNDGTERPLTLDDVLIVAPYNAQVDALADALPARARVGTVDKFQGQQAPIVIYSMATSSADLAPRGMRFLYSPNRLNVATSRAKCLAFVVASPALFTPDCRTPEQMRLANAFCRYRELAGTERLEGA